MSLTWTVFEILGTVAFAFSGATVGLARGMDVFGIALLSVVTAVGGGILRDVLAGIFPPFALRGPDGIIFALMTAAAVCIGFRHFHIPRRGRKLVLFAYRVSDTAGLAAFTVTGVITAIYSYPGYRYVLPVLLGLITAVGGGILRDVLAQKVPVVLYEDVYAMASVIGGYCYLRSVSAYRDCICIVERVRRGTSSPHLRNHFWLEVVPSGKDTRQRKRIAGMKAGRSFLIT